MPLSTPGRRSRNLGTTVPKSPLEQPATVPAPSSDLDLSARLQQIVGGSLDEIDPSIDNLSDWSQVITDATRSGFEHRLLLGLAFNAMKPEYGRITQQQERIAEALGRTSRWVRETSRVAGTVQLAFEEGITLPLEIRDLSWRMVPGAIENIRMGHPLDYRAEKEETEPTPEEQAQAVAKALAALTKALDTVQAATQRQTLATEAIAALEPYTEPDPASEPVDEGSSPSPSSRQPGRNRPGRNPRWRRR